jgi:8-oxo-dGTP pyrophosphatase MutT (NUDIX family)
VAKRRSAGVVVVQRTDAGWRYLVLRCFRNWDFPKGVIEPSETPLQAALREVREETSLDALDLRWGEAFRETAPYAGGKVARYHVALSAGGDVHLPVSPTLGRPEHHEFRWVSDAEARRLLPPRLQPIIDWAAEVVG